MKVKVHVIEKRARAYVCVYVYSDAVQRDFTHRSVA